MLCEQSIRFNATFSDPFLHCYRHHRVHRRHYHCRGQPSYTHLPQDFLFQCGVLRDASRPFSVCTVPYGPFLCDLHGTIVHCYYHHCLRHVSSMLPAHARPNSHHPRRRVARLPRDGSRPIHGRPFLHSFIAPCSTLTALTPSPRPSLQWCRRARFLRLTRLTRRCRRYWCSCCVRSRRRPHLGCRRS